MDARRGRGGGEHQLAAPAVPPQREDQLLLRGLVDLVDPRAERLLFDFVF